MQAKHVLALRRHAELEELEVAEPWVDRRDRDPVPLHIDERGGLLIRRTERTRVEEPNAVLPSWEGIQRLGWRQCARERVGGGRGA